MGRHADVVEHPSPCAGDQRGPPEMEARPWLSCKRTAEFLSQAQRFSVTVDMGFDAVQDSGQKIEFGHAQARASPSGSSPHGRDETGWLKE